MANIKITELQSDLFEELSDASLGSVYGGDAPSFQLILGGTSATTGAAAGGRVNNSTSSTFTLNASLTSSNFSASVTTFANSFSLPF